MIRVAYLIDHLRVGGAQRHLVQVVKGLDRDRYAPEMWTASADPGDLAPEFERLGVPVRTFGMHSSLIHPRTAVAVARVAREFRRRDVHVAHGYLFEGNLFAALVGRFARTPVTLVSKRSLDRYRRKDHWVAACLSNRLADKVLVNASAVEKLVVEHERCPRERIRLIPNGVALPPAAPAGREPRRDGDGPLIGMVGRLDWKKGYEHALAAMSLLHARIPEARLDIVGDGPFRGALEEQARQLGLEETVRFLGQRHDATELMRDFDCYVLSSVIEGMPNALLEAMSLGRPAVTTSAGGSAEVVVDGKSGLVVPPADPTALADAMERVLRDRAFAESLGAAAAKRAREDFSAEAMLQALDHLYRTELARAGLKLAPAPVEASNVAPGRGVDSHALSEAHSGTGR